MLPGIRLVKMPGASSSKPESLSLRQVTSNIGQITFLHDPSTTAELLCFAGLSKFEAMAHDLMENSSTGMLRCVLGQIFPGF
jgi:hypothetical protein